ncbi:MAG: hypothetical protein ACREP8_10875, partial [Candidatus Binatia bacterium]
SWLWQIAFHPNRTRQTLNEVYAEVEKYRQNLANLRPEAVGDMESLFRAKTTGLTWWWRNPGGKILLKLIWINPVASMVDYARMRERTAQLLFALANFQEPETRPETQPMPFGETQPSATPIPSPSPLPEGLRDFSLSEKWAAPDRMTVIKLKPGQISPEVNETQLTETIRLTPFVTENEFSAFRVGEVQAGSVWELLGLQSGDILFAFNGREPGSDLPALLANQLYLGSSPLEWLVFRNGRWVKLVDEWVEPGNARPEATPAAQAPVPAAPQVPSRPTIEGDAL